jgi:hypothetical protein
VAIKFILLGQIEIHFAEMSLGWFYLKFVNMVPEFRIFSKQEVTNCQK